MTILPPDFFDDQNTGSAVNELIDAASIARQNLGSFVQVGELRWLFKEPSAWTSEVRTGKKAELGGKAESWDARWWLASTEPNDDDGAMLYGKALVFYGLRNPRTDTTR